MRSRSSVVFRRRIGVIGSIAIVALDYRHRQYWFRCRETFLRRHVTDEWSQHAEACEFYREPVEQR